MQEYESLEISGKKNLWQESNNRKSLKYIFPLAHQVELKWLALPLHATATIVRSTTRRTVNKAARLRHLITHRIGGRGRSEEPSQKQKRQSTARKVVAIHAIHIFRWKESGSALKFWLNSGASKTDRFDCLFPVASLRFDQIQNATVYLQAAHWRIQHACRYRRERECNRRGKTGKRASNSVCLPRLMHNWDPCSLQKPAIHSMRICM